MPEKQSDFEADEIEFLEALATSREQLRDQFARCPSPAVLVAAKSDVVPEQTRQDVEDHLATCALCRRLASDLTDDELSKVSSAERARVLATITSRMDGAPDLAKRPVRRFAWWLEGTAAVAALATIAVVIVVFRGHRPSSPARKADSGVAQQPTLSSSPSALLLEKLPVRLDPAILVWRSAAKDDTQRYAEGLRDALAPYAADDFAGAADRLEQLAGSFPHRPEANLYLGICRLYLQQNAAAIRSLQAAQSAAGDSLLADATWYLGMAYARAGDNTRSASELRKLCDGTSGYATRACAGLTELDRRP